MLKTKIRRKLHLLFFLVFAAVCMRPAYSATSAEYTALGKKAAIYLGAVMMLQELQRGTCKAYLKDEEKVRVDFSNIKQEVLRSFPPSYRSDLQQLFKEVESSRSEYTNSFSDPKINPPEQCARIIGYTIGLVSSAIKDWNDAKSRFGLQ